MTSSEEKKTPVFDLPNRKHVLLWENNEAYVENMIPDASIGEKKKMMSILGSYGEDKWWLLQDPIALLEKQMKEDYLLVDFNDLRQIICWLFEKPVALKNFDEGNDFEKLKQDIRIAVRKKKAEESRGN